VPNPERGTSAADYEDMIAACFSESKRTLRSDGRLVLTFHNKKLAAWRALGGALKKAGFTIAAIAVVLAENASDHCKRSVSAFLYDLVIECVPARRTNAAPVFVAPSAATPQQRNLIAMGLALAAFVRSKPSLDLAALFHDHLAAVRESRRLIA
jgi:adenine-specific DNA methylase